MNTNSSFRAIKPKTMLLIFLFIMVSSLLILFINGAGKRLVISHDFDSADIIMVLMGPIPDRVLQASDLYHSGISEKIVFCNDHQPGSQQLAKHGIMLDNTAEIAKKTFLQLGVPENVIHVFDHSTASTQEEALALRDYLKEHPEIGSVIIVTSSYHSKRTYRIFNKAVSRAGLDVQIYLSPNPYTNFQQQRWWSDRPSAAMVLLEHLKLLNFYIIEQHRL